MSNDIYQQDGKICYSKFLSALFSSGAIIALSILCLLNYMTLDVYSTLALFKVVAPGSISFWILGNIIGKKLDSLENQVITKKIESEQQAYEIPSMFAAEDTGNEIAEVENIDG